MSSLKTVSFLTCVLSYDGFLSDLCFGTMVLIVLLLYVYVLRVFTNISNTTCLSALSVMYYNKGAI